MNLTSSTLPSQVSCNPTITSFTSGSSCHSGFLALRCFQWWDSNLKNILHPWCSLAPEYYFFIKNTLHPLQLIFYCITDGEILRKCPNWEWEKATLVSDGGLYLNLCSDNSGIWNENLRPPFNRKVTPISRNYGLRNHFRPLESAFFSWGEVKIGVFSQKPLMKYFSECISWIYSSNRSICTSQPTENFLRSSVFRRTVAYNYRYQTCHQIGVRAIK